MYAGTGNKITNGSGGGSSYGNSWGDGDVVVLLLIWTMAHSRSTKMVQVRVKHSQELVEIHFLSELWWYPTSFHQFY